MSGQIVRQPALRVVYETRGAPAEAVATALRDLGSPPAEWQSGRLVQLFERPPLRWLPVSRPPQLVESSVTLFRFVVPASLGEQVAATLASPAVDPSGHALLRLEPIDVVGANSPWLAAGPAPSPAEGASTARLLTHLAGVSFIVPRRLGNQVARVALDHGLGVPVITFGLGTGLRDKLGLLRITIPPEKEIVSLAMPAADAEMAVALVIGKLRLDRPGRGFIHGHPIHAASLHTRMRLGEQRHAATIEQIIDALDNLHNGTGWRRRFDDDEHPASQPNRRFLRHRRSLELVCDEERSREFVGLALQAGAGGATSCQAKMVVYGKDFGDTAPPIIRSTLVVPESRLEAIVDALATGGFFEAAGRLEIASCLFAFN